MGTKVQTKTTIPTSEGNKISIDSLKIRIPIENVKIIDEALNSKWILINEATGEIDEETFKENSLRKHKNGIKVKYAIEVVNSTFKTRNKYVTILLPSKVLKEPYFEGITAENIEIVYIELLKHKVINFTLETLLNSVCTDVDFKKDIQCTNLGYKLKKLVAATRPSKKKNEGCFVYDKINNTGIEFSDRRTTSFRSNPFLKIYDKAKELNNNSYKFSDEYLKNVNYDNKVRIEATVKNKAHFKYLGIEETTLKSLLSLSDEQKENIINYAISKHLEPRTMEIKTPSILTPNEMIIHYSINLALNNGMSFETFRNESTKAIKDKTTRSRKRKELNSIYYKHIKGTSIDNEANEMNEFFDKIGYL